MEFFSGSGSNLSKPSLFELIAQEQLRDLLQPAVKYVLSVFAQRYPRYLLRIVNNHEEIYALIMLLVERHHLYTHSSSFAESFYGLRRRRRPRVDLTRTRVAIDVNLAEEALQPRDIKWSLFFLASVGLPYLRAKAHDYYEKIGGGLPSDAHGVNDEPLASTSFSSTYRRVFKSAFPWVNISFETCLLYFNILYIFEKTPYYRPWLGWMKLDIRRVTSADIMNSDTSTKTALLLSGTQRLTSLPGWLLKKVLNSLKHLLPMSIFFIKFLEWWYSPSSPARALAAPSPRPLLPAPRMLSPHPKGIQVDPTRYGECPICHGPVTNATALPSGYVFCYRCAYGEVERHGQCPVTLTPAQTEQLRKVLI